MPIIILLQAAILLANDPAAAPITALAVAPDGRYVVAGSQAGVRIVSLASDATDGESLARHAAPQRAFPTALATSLEHVHDLAFSAAGDMLAIAGGSPGEKGGVELWSWPEAKLIRQFSAGGDVAYRLAWNADGTALAIACGDKKVRIQKIFGEKPSVFDCHSAAVLAVAWLTSDRLVVSAGVDQSLRVLDPASGNVVRSLDNHTAPVRDLAVRPGEHTGPTLVTSASADRTVRFWQPAIGRLVRFVRLPSAPTAICWTPSGSHVLAACEDGRLRAIDPDTVAVREIAAQADQEADASRSPGWAYAVASLPDGKSAVIGGERGRLQIVPLFAITP